MINRRSTLICLWLAFVGFILAGCSDFHLDGKYGSCLACCPVNCLENGPGSKNANKTVDRIEVYRSRSNWELSAIDIVMNLSILASIRDNQLILKRDDPSFIIEFLNTLQKEQRIDIGGCNPDESKWQYHILVTDNDKERIGYIKFFPCHNDKSLGIVQPELGDYPVWLNKGLAELLRNRGNHTSEN